MDDDDLLQIGLKQGDISKLRRVLSELDSIPQYQKPNGLSSNLYPHVSSNHSFHPSMKQLQNNLSNLSNKTSQSLNNNQIPIIAQLQLTTLTSTTKTENRINISQSLPSTTSASNHPQITSSSFSPNSSISPIVSISQQSIPTTTFAKSSADTVVVSSGTSISSDCGNGGAKSNLTKVSSPELTLNSNDVLAIKSSTVPFVSAMTKDSLMPRPIMTSSVVQPVSLPLYMTTPPPTHAPIMNTASLPPTSFSAPVSVTSTTIAHLLHLSHHRTPPSVIANCSPRTPSLENQVSHPMQQQPHHQHQQQQQQQQPPPHQVKLQI